MRIDFTETRYNWRDGKEYFYNSHHVEAETETECFKQIYCGYIRPSRYCSDVRYKLNDSEQQKRWLKWREHGVTIDMFYGNATVD